MRKPEDAASVRGFHTGGQRHRFSLHSPIRRDSSFQIFCLPAEYQHSLLFRMQARTASITALRNPFSSRTPTASMVVPRGEHTISFS